LLRQELWREEPGQREENSKMLLQSNRALLSALIGILVATVLNFYKALNENGTDKWKAFFIGLTLGLETITCVLLIIKMIDISSNSKLNTTIETLIYLITLLFLIQIAL
jgi:hypothetical protein